MRMAAIAQIMLGVDFGRALSESCPGLRGGVFFVTRMRVCLAAFAQIAIGVDSARALPESRPGLKLNVFL